MNLVRLFNRSHRLALALWLALLLPLAQAAAVRHEISHLSEQRSQRQDTHAVACEACLAFAQVGSAALPQLPATLQAPQLSFACPSTPEGLGQPAQLPSRRNRGPPRVL